MSVTIPKFSGLIPLSHGIDDLAAQQAVKQLERLVQELQAWATSYKAITTSDGGNTSTATASTTVIVDYVATGSEGVDFFVPIGTPMVDGNYAVVWAPEGEAAVPVIDLPNGTGDRSSTQFRVMTNAQVTAGDKLTFILFQR